jgi:hypothetical protein
VIGAVIALVIVGLVLGFIIPPFGFIPAALGLILFVLFLAGFRRRTTQPGP